MRPLLVNMFASHWFGIFILFYVSFWLNNRRATGNNWFCDSFHSVTTNAGFSKRYSQSRAGEIPCETAFGRKLGVSAYLRQCSRRAFDLSSAGSASQNLPRYLKGCFSSDTGIVDRTWELYRPQIFYQLDDSAQAIILFWS
jgi:hypothetical protein